MDNERLETEARVALWARWWNSRGALVEFEVCGFSTGVKLYTCSKRIAINWIMSL